MFRPPSTRPSPPVQSQTQQSSDVLQVINIAFPAHMKPAPASFDVSEPGLLGKKVSHLYDLIDPKMGVSASNSKLICGNSYMNIKRKPVDVCHACLASSFRSPYSHSLHLTLLPIFSPVHVSDLQCAEHPNILSCPRFKQTRPVVLIPLAEITARAHVILCIRVYRYLLFLHSGKKYILNDESTSDR